LGLSRKIALGAAFGLLALNVPSLASEVVACDMKKVARPGAAEAATRKPVEPVPRARPERREQVYYSPTPSRRIILQ
jgi:hypothetical protein